MRRPSKRAVCFATLSIPDQLFSRFFVNVTTLQPAESSAFFRRASFTMRRSSKWNSTLSYSMHTFD